MTLIPYQNPISVPDGTVGVTQPLSDISTKLATTEFVLNKLLELSTYTKEPSGFLNTTDSTISLNDGTRTFSIAPTTTSYDYWNEGVRYNETTTKNLVLPDVEGPYYIYYDGNTLSYLNSFDISLIFEFAFIATTYWDATNQKFLFMIDERHGIIMDSATHYYLHTTLGTDYRSGFSLTNLVVDGDATSNTHAQFNISSGKFADEDILFDYTSTTNIPILYKTGAANWRSKDADSYPLIYNGVVGYTGTRIAFNNLTTGTWSLQEVQEGYYMLMHVFAYGDRSKKIFAVLGNNEYSSLVAARDGATTEITAITGLPLQEFVPLGTVIFQSSSSYANTPKARTISVDALGNSYLDYRNSYSLNLAGAIGNVNSHSLLADLDNDDHTQYLNITRGDARYYTEAEVDSFLNAKQNLNAILTSLAGLSATAGLVVQTGATSFIKRNVAGTLNRVSITNVDGVAGDITVDISASYVGQTSITTLGTITTGVWNGTAIPIANGGTGQTTKTAAFDALSPNTTKGDLIVHNGTNNVRIPVGVNKYTIVADSANANGIKWVKPFERVTDTNVQTTTSTTPVLIPSMTLTPGVGDYEALFNADIVNNANNRTMIIYLYLNGVEQTRRVFINASTQNRTHVNLVWPVVVTNPAHVVEIRWSTSAGTMSIDDRIFKLTREI